MNVFAFRPLLHMPHYFFYTLIDMEKKDKHAPLDIPE
jgi:hypothetical protein